MEKITFSRTEISEDMLMLMARTLDWNQREGRLMVMVYL